MPPCECGFHAQPTPFDGDNERQGGRPVERGDDADDARSDRRADADAEQDDARGGRSRIRIEQAHESEQQESHRDGKRGVLRVDEHVPVVERAGGQEGQRHQSGQRPRQLSADAPGCEQADEAECRADQAARLEQIERQELGEQRGRHVEAAAVHIQIDEGERAGVAEAGAVKSEQELAHLGVRIVIPAKAIVAEGEGGDNGNEREDEDCESVQSARAGPFAWGPPERKRNPGLPCWRGVPNLASLIRRYFAAASYISATWSQLTR